MIEIRSLRDVMRLFFIFRKEFWRAVLVTAIVVLLGAFFLPTRYASDARLLVKPTELQQVQMPLQPGSDGGFVQQSSQRDPLLDEEKLATSEPVMQRVAAKYLELSSIKPTGLWAKIKFQAGAAVGWCKEVVRDGLVLVGLMDPAPPQDRLAVRLAKRMQAVHEPGSNVMEMRVLWGDPAVAQALSQAWVDAYFDERAKAAGGDNLFDFYQQQSDQLSNDILSLKGNLRTQLRSIDATSVEQRIEDITDQLQKLYRQRREAMVEREALAGVLVDGQKRLPGVAGEVVTTREISLNPAQQDLLLKLNGLRAQRLDLLRTYLEDAPPIKAIDESIASLQHQIDRQASSLQRSQNLSPNSLGVKLRQDMQDAQVRGAQLDANIKELDRQVSDLQSEREKVMAEEPQLSRLSMQLQSAEKTFAQYSDYLLRARVVRDLNRHRLSNVTLIGKSSYSPNRVFPKSMLMLALVIPIALAVGLLTIFVLYLLDQRIHDGGRIESRFGVSVWGTLPEKSGDASALRSAVYRVSCRLPLEEAEERGVTVGLTSNRSGEGVSFIAEQLRDVLQAQGRQVRIDGGPAMPGELVLRRAPPLTEDHALLALRGCDRVVLVVRARHTTVPAVEHALTLLRDAVGRVDGIILNRRVFEIPARSWRYLGRWLGAN